MLLPETSLWWLQHYERFREHLKKRYRPLVREETCLIFDLRGFSETADRASPARTTSSHNANKRAIPGQ